MSGFDWDKDYSLEELLQSVIAIKELPNRLAKIINSLKLEDFDKSYRDGGWNIRQTHTSFGGFTFEWIFEVPTYRLWGLK